jgi:ribosome biogenesis GTPase A
MSIQWFPGHMNKAKKTISDLMPEIDIVIELLDARAPFSSCNPLLHYLTKNKKNIKLLNKADLADETITQKWINFFRTKNNSIAIPGNKDDLKQKNQIIKLCRELAPNRKSFEKPIRAMIIGIPNVGKSTLINKLVNKKSAKTGDIPAVTKSNQCLTIADNFIIYDTPGMMWQKIQYEQVGNNLAICNSIGKRAIDEELLAMYLINYLKEFYPKALQNRYKLDDIWQTLYDNQILNHIGKNRGCVLSGGRIDVQKTSELIIQDFRMGKIDKISLETPELWDKWISEFEKEQTIEIE